MAKGGKKGRKIGRRKEKCKRYAAAGTRELNKVRKIEKHLKNQPHDEQAREALQSL